jgi:hypothetical protein
LVEAGDFGIANGSVAVGSRKARAKTIGETNKLVSPEFPQVERDEIATTLPYTKSINFASFFFLHVCIPADIMNHYYFDEDIRDETVMVLGEM